MRKFEELNHYEVLETPINASTFQIRQAYKEALSIYDVDSSISYSFFSEEESKEILDRIEEAFSTLIDQKKRELYNKTLIREKKIDPSSLKKKRQKVPTPLFSSKTPGGAAISKTIKKRIKGKDLKKAGEAILSKDMISGDDLKHLRKTFGVKIEDLFEVTRITVSILKAIENDDFGTLPPTVYLKNFLKAYAELFEIDSKKIIDGYIKNLNHIKGTS
ncbi:MAG: helix-turn-helix domain-containing protein [Desulfobacteraceae bacterium]|nr:helix-turn-helix domain-containing protein [Desulfobacteraceae bacterium]